VTLSMLTKTHTRKESARPLMRGFRGGMSSVALRDATHCVESFENRRSDRTRGRGLLRRVLAPHSEWYLILVKENLFSAHLDGFYSIVTVCKRADLDPHELSLLKSDMPALTAF
jgi:hypothetical protein